MQLLTIDIVVQLVVYIASVAAMWGKFSTRLGNLEKSLEDFKKDVKDDMSRLEAKQDKHNNLIGRMFIVEESAKSAHHRIDELREAKNS